MEKEKIIDQSQLAEDVSAKIPYEFLDSLLVKPLDPIMVEKEFSTPVSNEEAKKDANGIEAKDFDKVKKETKQVESDYRKGVILKVPTDYEVKFKVGDIVIFLERSGRFFDLLKDSRLVRPYDVVAIQSNSNND